VIVDQKKRKVKIMGKAEFEKSLNDTIQSN